MSKITISVVLPVYNVESYLDECIQSVFRQSFTHFELICINDGSTDNSLSILESYLDRFQGRMTIKSIDNGGLANARNVGLNLAQGEFIYFLDSDDYIADDTLELCLQSIVSHDADLVVFNAEAFCSDDFDGLNELNYERDLPKSLYVNESIFEDSYKIRYIAQSCCYFYRKNSFPNLRFIKGILHEDHYFSTILYIRSSKTVVLKNSLFKRRVRPNSITTSKPTMRHAEGYYITVKALYKEFPKKSELLARNSTFNDYLNSLLRHGIKAELEFRGFEGNTMTFSRKFEIFKMFVNIVNLKTFTLLFMPRVFYYTKRLKMTNMIK